MIKEIQEDMILFHQTMKEYVKPHIVEEDTKEGTIKGEDTSNLKFNAIIIKKKIVILYMNLEVLLTIWKEKPIMLEKKSRTYFIVGI